jgi:hypothetical protein
MCGENVNVAIHQSVVFCHPTETCRHVAGLFAGPWGGTSGSAASQPSMMFLWFTLNTIGLLALLSRICVVNTDVWTKIAVMCHMFKWLPLLSVVSMSLHSSTQCSSTQKMCHHSHDPIMYKAGKAV